MVYLNMSEETCFRPLWKTFEVPNLFLDPCPRVGRAMATSMLGFTLRNSSQGAVSFCVRLNLQASLKRHHHCFEKISQPSACHNASYRCALRRGSFIAHPAMSS